MTTRRVLLVILTLLSAGCAGRPPEPEPAPLSLSDSGPTQADLARLATLVSWMSGSFDSADQAAQDPATYLDIRMHTAPIWTDTPGGTAKWLYVEQAGASQPSAPYRQRIYRLSSLGGGKFTSEAFELPGNPQTFAGAWKRPDAFAQLTPDQLVARAGCTIYLTDRKDAFVGGTREHDCASTLQGAAYATSEVVISADQLMSWDRGFDAEDKQVWGATKAGYVFRKRTR